MQSGEVVWVEDARADARFRGEPEVVVRSVGLAGIEGGEDVGEWAGECRSVHGEDPKTSS